MWFSLLISRHCCGGPVLFLALLCLGVGLLFVALSATVPGLVFIAVGVFAEALCLALGRNRCPNRYDSEQMAD
jgi:hypothetical protein